jgi:nitroreductase
MAKIFELAQYSPSNCNIQPWFSFVSSGRSKNNLIKKFLKSHSKGIKPDSDYEYPSDFKSELVYMTRQVGAASELYKKMKIISTIVQKINFKKILIVKIEIYRNKNILIASGETIIKVR